MTPTALQRVLSAAGGVRERLAALLASAGLERPRMSELVRGVGLDKSIASRLARALRASDEAATIRDLPGTEALQHIVTRLAGDPRSADGVKAARAAIAALDQALLDFPGDRNALATAIAGLSPGSAERAAAPGLSRARLKSSRRGAHDAFVFAQGISSEAQSCITILKPGSESGHADQAMVLGTHGLRRLRPGHPYSLLSLQGRPGTDGGYERSTLAGEPVRNDPSAALIREFSTPSASSLRLNKVGGHYTLVLDPHLPPLDEPMDVAFGLVNPNFELCRKKGDNRWSMTSYTVSRPCRLFLREVLLHRDTFGGCVPKALFSIDTIPVPNADTVGPCSTGRGLVEHGEGLVSMGAGYARHGESGHDFAVPLALRAFEMLGCDPDDFVRFRMVVDYPLPMVRGEVWMELPD